MAEQQQERQRMNQRPQQDAALQITPGSRIEAISENLEEMLRAGDEIIQRSLSDNSQEFVRAMRQRGGQ